MAHEHDTPTEPALPSHPNQNTPAVTRAKQAQFLKLLSETGQIRPSCDAVGIAYHTPYQWGYKSAAFKEKYAAARLAGDQVLLQRFEQQIDGRIMEGKADPQSAVLTMFRVKKLDPSYRDNAVAQVNMVGPIAIQFNLAAPASILQAQTDPQAEIDNAG